MTIVIRASLTLDLSTLSRILVIDERPTLWGAKGVTAEHVYLLGVCKEALPGERRDEYPGTDADYVDEQRRLFYVSITRAKKTLVREAPRARKPPR